MSRNKTLIMLTKSVGQRFPEAKKHAFWVFPRVWKYFVRAKYRNEIRLLSRKNTDLALRPNSAYAKRIDSFWKTHYGKRVNTAWHAVCAGANGLEDERYIPKDLCFSEIYPWLNRQDLADAYIDKNSSDVFLEGVVAPTTILRKINGNFYLDKRHPISCESASDHLLAHEGTVFIKPSFACCGRDVRSLVIRENTIYMQNRPVAFRELDAKYGRDYIIQARIEQHPLMQEIYPGSVNTLRMVTFRFRGKIHLLLAFARFGDNSSIVDNLAAGGVACGIAKDGRLNEFAFDKYGQKYEKHPFTGYVFKDGLIPNFDAFSDQVVALHRQLPYFDLVSWDIAVGPHAEPILVELNLAGDSTIYQIVHGPLFGSFTEELLENIRESQ